jgi:hypothetical protein
MPRGGLLAADLSAALLARGVQVTPPVRPDSVPPYDTQSNPLIQGLPGYKVLRCSTTTPLQLQEPVPARAFVCLTGLRRTHILIARAAIAR